MKRVPALALALLLLAGCAPREADGGRTHILCTTYPIYLFTTAVTQDAEGVEVELLVNQQTSCLHDYTLSVNDMKAIDRSDVIVMNGAGLEDFMADALEQKDVPVIDCSENIDLLPAPDHHHHEGEDEAEHEVDPHYWMDPERAAVMAENIAHGLSALDEGNADSYHARAAAVQDTLNTYFQGWPPEFEDISRRELITFHDGFQYFADAFDLTILKSIEEEEGSEASAQELREIIELVKTHRLSAIFVEINGSHRSAQVIARETGCRVYELDMLMSGSVADVDIHRYIAPMYRNLQTVICAMNGEEYHEMEGL